jgi:putative phosphoribosyl transferase
VVGLARGGVEVAAEVAEVLGLPLDALAVRKVGHPSQPEYGIGAVTPDGTVFVRAHDGLTDEELERAVDATREKADELDRRLHGVRSALSVRDETVILVDDGLATGATMTVAVRWAKGAGATRVVVAVPVAPPESVAGLGVEADDFVCLAEPPFLAAVGFWYLDFAQVSDERVADLLERADERLRPPRPDGAGNAHAAQRPS